MDKITDDFPWFVNSHRPPPKQEQKIKCPYCGEMMPASLLNDLNHCDNCGYPARLF